MKLEGLRVVDLSLFLPGPHVTLMMADHGADVIKVEPPGEGEPNRHIGPKIGGHSVFFRNTHRGKRSVCINLKHPEGREALLRLCESADVLVEAFRPGVVDRLGVGYAAVSARNPRIVYCSIAAFGQSGPYRDLPAHDLATEALAGVVSLNIGNDGEPTMPHMPTADMSASMLAFGGIMMALYRRQSTGRGDYLDMAMHDSVLAWTPNIVGEVFANRRAPVVRHERSLGGSAFYNIYRTKDGLHVVLGAQEIKFVRNLLGELGRLDFVPLAERGPGPHQQPLIEFLRATFLTRTRAEWIEWFRGRDVSFAPVNDLRQAFDDPHAAARGMRLVDEQGLEHIGVPIKFRDEPAQPRFALPAVGQHNAEVLRSIGYSDAAIAALRAAGAIGEATGDSPPGH
jgi:crotonobetainyl-CoA:carnitine CoA-transferase CaiB-like acyl-CoA transferase